MAAPAANRPLRIALAVWGEFGRRVSIGAVRFARPSRAWELCELPEHSDAFAYLRALRPAGVILYAGTASLWQQAARLRCPVVNVSARLPADAPLPTVCVDSAAAATMAADYFLTRGFRHFAFVTSTATPNRRHDAYQTALGRVGLTMTAWLPPLSNWPQQYLARPFAERLIAPARRWLRQLPKPVGILCDTDLLAAALAAACTHSGVAVPEEVAIVGIGNDALRCERTWPPISSVDQNGEEVGYRAAELLERLIQGDRPPRDRRYISPRGVVTRLSSDISVVADVAIARALRYISAHLHEPLAVDDIAAGIGIGRRTLERRFREHRGHTVRHQIHLARLERAQQLLTETEEPLAEVAERAGFGNVVSFYQLFRRHTGQTPGEFRARPRR